MLNHVQLFENPELKRITTLSHKIVTTLSENYTSIINGMIATSVKTKKTYLNNVKSFLAFIQLNGIDSFSFGNYRTALEKTKLSRRTLNGYLAAAKALLKESIKYGILPVDITANVPAFKIPSGHTKDGVKENELIKVWQYLPTIKRESTRRKVKILLQLFTCEGLRQMEAQQIRIEDINFTDCSIQIRSKGSEEKAPVLIFERTANQLKEYVSYLERESGYLFGKPNNPAEPITLRAIRKIFTHPKSGVFVKAGIEGRSTHGFRHFFTTRTLEETNGDLHKTAMRTRHKATATLRVYDDRRINRAEIEKMEGAFIFG